MATHTLHSNLYSSGPNKILVLANYAGTQLDRVILTSFSTLSTEEYLKKNPNAKSPILDTERGSLYESNAICRYFARQGNLYGESLYE